MRFGIDADDVLEVLGEITPRRGRPRGGFVDPATAHDDDIKGVVAQIRRFLEELPGEVSVSELREALDEAIGGSRHE